MKIAHRILMTWLISIPLCIWLEAPWYAGFSITLAAWWLVVAGSSR